MHSQEISDNEIYLLIKYIKSVLWRVAKRLSYIEDARCLKVNAVVVVLLMIQVLWNVRPCRLFNSYGRSEWLLRQGQAVQKGLLCLTLKVKALRSFQT